MARRKDKATEALLLKLFSRRDDLLKIKLEEVGSQINHYVAGLMAEASPTTQRTLVKEHETLEPATLDTAFEAACRSMKPADVFKEFSSYLTAKVDEKKKLKDPAFGKRETIVSAISHDWRWRRTGHDDEIAWDPRWLDVAVASKRLDLVTVLARPGHAGSNELLSEAFDKSFSKTKDSSEWTVPLATMVKVQHPAATEKLLAALAKYGTAKSKSNWGVYWISRLIPNLPRSAVPKLEELMPTLDEKVIDQLVGFVSELKIRRDTSSQRTARRL